jgi:hypothetical protein
MICFCIFLWIKSEFCCHSRSCVFRDRCTIESEWGVVDCMRFCVLVSWRHLLSIERERTLRSRFRSELGVMVCRSVCCASRVSVDWMAPSRLVTYIYIRYLFPGAWIWCFYNTSKMPLIFITMHKLIFQHFCYVFVVYYIIPIPNFH